MMSQATAGIVGPVLGMLGAALVFVGILPVVGRIIDSAEPVASPAPVIPPTRGWHAPTARVTCPAYRPTRRARRHHTGAHRLSGLAPGQRYAPTLNTTHIVRSHAA